MENDRLNEIRELNPDYDISMHELDVCVGDNQYRLMYYVYVQHKESGIGVYGDKDFDMQSINLQFNCNDIASSLKAQRDKIKQLNEKYDEKADPIPVLPYQIKLHLLPFC